MKHIAWDYEYSIKEYYHLYPVSEEGDVILQDGSLDFDIPQTKENDDIVQEIVNRLDKLAEKL